MREGLKNFESSIAEGLATTWREVFDSRVVGVIAFCVLLLKPGGGG